MLATRTGAAVLPEDREASVGTLRPRTRPPMVCDLPGARIKDTENNLTTITRKITELTTLTGIYGSEGENILNISNFRLSSPKL